MALLERCERCDGPSCAGATCEECAAILECIQEQIALELQLLQERAEYIWRAKSADDAEVRAGFWAAADSCLLRRDASARQRRALHQQLTDRECAELAQEEVSHVA